MSDSWPFLFVGALLDALIGPNLIVPGEPFLLAAGYQLHAGYISGVIAVFLGGLIGDQSSYWIGYRYGYLLQKKLITKIPRFKRLFARAKLFTRQNDKKVLLFARMLGPIAWIVPFIAGTQHIHWKRFSLFSGIGLILGIGQFVVWGYLLALGIDSIPFFSSIKSIIEENLTLILLSISLVIILWGGLRYYSKVH